MEPEAPCYKYSSLGGWINEDPLQEYECGGPEVEEDAGPQPDQHHDGHDHDLLRPGGARHVSRVTCLTTPANFIILHSQERRSYYISLSKVIIRYEGWCGVNNGSALTGPSHYPHSSPLLSPP